MQAAGVMQVSCSHVYPVTTSVFAHVVMLDAHTAYELKQNRHVTWTGRLGILHVDVAGKGCLLRGDGLMWLDIELCWLS